MAPGDFERLFKESAEREQRRQAEEQLEKYVRVFAGIYDKAVAYTQAIVAVAYAAVFGVWAFVRDLMSPGQHAAAGLLLLFSAVTFALWEVGTNITSARALSAFSLRLRQIPLEAVKSMEEYERAQRENSLKSAQMWAIAVAICLVTGVSAFAIMVWSLAMQLVETLRK